MLDKSSNVFYDQYWQLGFQGKFDVLESLAKEQGASLINLNVAPTAEDSFDKGLTLAWMLASKEQWKLLKELCDKVAEPVNLNAAPEGKGNPYEGVTVALCLVAKKKFDLLETLANKKNAQPIDLNAFPRPLTYPNYGMTLALYLSLNKKWELLESIADSENSSPINLNLTIQAEEHSSKGISLAWHLARNKKFKLLEKLAMKKGAELIDLTIKPLDSKHPRQQTVTDLLLAHRQDALLLNILHLAIQQNTSHSIFLLKECSSELMQKCPETVENLLKSYEVECLQNLVNSLPENPMLWQTQLILSEKVFDGIKNSLITYTHLSPEIKKEVNEHVALIFNLLTQIPSHDGSGNSAYYKKSQDKLGHLLMDILACEDTNLHKEVIENLNALIPHTFQSIPESSMLRQTILICLSKAQNFELLSNFFAETENKRFSLEKQNIALEKENHQLKRKIEQVENSSTQVSLPKNYKSFSGILFTSSPS